MSAPSKAADVSTSTSAPNGSLATAQRSADEARSLYWAAQAQTNFDNGDPSLAYGLAIQANSMSNPPVQAQRTLNNIAYEPGPRSMFGEYLKDAVFTANWRYMFTISEQNEITMWDTATGKIIRHFVGPDEYLNNIVLSPDEHSLLSVGREGEMLVWDVETGKEIHRIVGNGLSSLADAKALFSPDGSKVVTFDNGSDITVPNISLWDVTTGQEVGRFPGSEPQFSPDGNLLLVVTGYNANTSGIEIWDTRTGQKVVDLKVSKQPIGSIYGAIFSPNSKRIVSYGDKLIWWDVKTGEEIQELVGHDPNVSVHNAVFSPDGKRLVTSDEGGGLIVWDTEYLAEEKRLNGFDTGVDVTFSADGRKMLTESAHYINYCADCATTISQSSNPKLLLWDTQFFSLIHDYSRRNFNINRGRFENVTIDRSQLSPNGEHVATLSEGAVTLWDTGNSQIIHNFTGQNPDLRMYGFDQSLHGTVYSPDRKNGLTISNPLSDVGKGVMTLYNLADNKILVSFSGHTKPIRSTAFSPDGKYIVSGTDYGEMILWDSSTGQIIRQFVGQKSDVMDVKFSPDGRTVVSATGDAYSGNPELILWDVATGREIRRFIGHDQSVRLYSVAFSPDGRTIVSAGSDDTVDGQYRVEPHSELILWDVASGIAIRHLIGHKGDIYTVAFSPDGQHILSGGGIVGGELELFLWDVASGAIVERYSGMTWGVRHVSFSDDGHSVLSIGDYVDELIIWRMDSIAETIQWVLDNRVVPSFSCEQRQFYNVTPLCVSGELPVLTPFPTAMPSPTTDLTLTTATLTPTVTSTIPTVTPSLTPTIPTATPTLTRTPTSSPPTLEAEASSTAAVNATNRAAIFQTATAVTYTPSPTFNPGNEAVIGSQRDQLEPPKWKVWRYHGTGGEVVTIRVTADKPSDNQNAEVLLYPYFVLHGPNGALLETVNGIVPGHEDESVLQNYVLPATGIYEIEVRSRGFTSGNYTLVIESQSIKTGTPTATSSPTPITPP
ncbi:MAG: hypothetical protein H0X30_00970 [Anaerolineae bacterium]|nr:hypothetical protein [Anaerolineae bacterium]